MADTNEQNSKNPSGTYNFPSISFEQVLRNPSIFRGFSNGFVVARSQTDIMLIGTANGIPQLLINLPFATGKTLLEGLKNILDEVETAIGEVKQMPFVPIEQINK